MVDRLVSLILFVGDRYKHHSASSGYDQLVHLFPQAGYLSLRECEMGRLVWWRVPSAWAGAPRSLEETVDRLEGRIIWHILYGDFTTIPFQLRRLSRQAKIVVSLHQPGWVLKAYHPDLRALDAADLLIAVSQAQAEQVHKLGVETPVVPVRHGIWTTPFRPSGPVSDNGPVLFVGEHLRDWEFLRRVFSVLANEWRIKCRLIVPRHYQARFKDLSGVAVETGLSEAELITCYHDASLLFLPLRAATANNTLLEAMASGCPVICNRLPSVEEYLGDAGSYFPTGNLKVCLDAVLALYYDPAHRTRLSSMLLERAPNYDWEAIAPVYDRLYDQLWHDCIIPAREFSGL